MATGGNTAAEDVLVIPDEEEEEDWPEAGPENPAEAKRYFEKINDIFNGLSDLLDDDRKDTLPCTIRSFKKLVGCHWSSMADADAKAVIQTIQDPACIYLWQHLTIGGVDVSDADEEIPAGSNFIRNHPKICH